MHHLEIIYEDTEVLVVNKPAGLVSHPAGKFQGDSLVSRMHLLRGDNVRLLHRLDKGTSGLLLGAKNPDAVRSLGIQFERRKIHKKYLALVLGETLKEETIEVPMGNDLVEGALLPQRMLPHAVGISACTHYSLIKTNGDLSLVSLTPITGRRHQLRFHLAWRGNPILGDTLYQLQGLPFLWEKYLQRASPWPTLGGGHALHAWQISFFHPTQRQEMSFYVPPPLFWQPYLEKLSVSWEDIKNIKF